MIDWNRDGKVDGLEHGMTAFLIDEFNDGKATGCCGPTAAMFLMAILLPVIITAVFSAR